MSGGESEERCGVATEQGEIIVPCLAEKLAGICCLRVILLEDESGWLEEHRVTAPGSQSKRRRSCFVRDSFPGEFLGLAFGNPTSGVPITQVPKAEWQHRFSAS